LNDFKGESYTQGGESSKQGGESSKQGGESSNQGGESSKQGGDFYKEQEKTMEYVDPKLSEYHTAKMYRKETIHAFNDIIEEINKKGDDMDERQKEDLLNESIRLRSLIDHYSKYAENLKDELNVHSSQEEYNSEEYSSEDYSSDEEESRPSKRPRN
jgi:hypothetical protein